MQYEVLADHTVEILDYCDYTVSEVVTKVYKL